MTDYHVHFGQWGEKYFNAKSVFAELKNHNVDEIYFSSTTSGRYCKESFAVLNEKSFCEKLIDGKTLYELIRYEIQEAINTAKELKIIPHPLYWVIPELHLKKIVTIEKAMSELPYEGFKIHPRMHTWNLKNKETFHLATEIFEYASKNNLLILIHCGEDDFELPTVFEPFISAFPICTVQLAHCRPLEQTLYMLEKYSNAVCDTAFASDHIIEEIKQAGFEKRIRYGSDYPIGVLCEGL